MLQRFNTIPCLCLRVHFHALCAVRTAFGSLGTHSRLPKAQLNSHGVAAQVCNNMALAIQMASIAEASAMGRRLGLDPKVLAEVFNSSSARCWSSEAYNPVPVWHSMHLAL